MDSDAVDEYVTSAQSVIEQSPQLDEATTKAAILQDFIELLGWDVPHNTELEYSVEALGTVYKVDYALKLRGQPVAFVEAKGLDNTLTDEHREKIADYLTNENVTWGILTNGKQYEFYQRRIVSPDISIELIDSATIEELPQKQTILEAYQPEKIRDQEAQDIIRRIRQLRSARNSLREDKDELAADVADLISNETSEVVRSEAESQAKEMIDRLITDIESEVRPSEPSEGPESPTDDDIYQARILDNGDTISEFETEVQADLMAEVAEYLIQSHDLIQQLEPLPYIPGKKRAIVHTEPTYDGYEMKLPRELSDRYYVELNLSWEQKQREMKRMAEACGLSVTTEGI